MIAAPHWLHSSSLRFYSLLAFCLLLPVFGGEPLTELLRYQRELLGEQPWRLFTAHWVHLGWSHTLLNLVGLVFVGALLGGALGWRTWLLVVVVSAPGISLLLWRFNPQLEWYVGFSGVLHAMLMVGGMSAWQRGARDCGLLVVVLIGKLIYEQIAGAAPGSQAMAGGPVVVDAHLYGAIWGALLFLLLPRSALRKADDEGEAAER